MENLECSFFSQAVKNSNCIVFHHFTYGYRLSCSRNEVEFNLKAINWTSKGQFLFEDVFVEHFMGEFVTQGPR